ncbi:hypothetical protein ACFL3G_01365 [Planctomycetota bacterium]
MAKREKKRFSYPEFIIIFAILCFVAFSAKPAFMQAREQTNISQLVDGLEQLRASLDVYRTDHQNLPPTDSFEKFKAVITTKNRPSGSYLRNIPKNPFNNLNTIRFDGPQAGCGKAGWRLDTKTGLLQADNNINWAKL